MKNTIFILFLTALSGCTVIPVQPLHNTLNLELSSPIYFEFDYSETAPNIGSGGDSTTISLKIGYNGSYIVEKGFEPINNFPGHSLKKSGKLPEYKRQVLEKLLKELQIMTIKVNDIFLSQGSGLEDGWGGQIRLVSNTHLHSVRFSSHQGGISPWVEPVIKQRVLHFVQEIKMFAAIL